MASSSFNIVPLVVGAGLAVGGLAMVGVSLLGGGGEGDLDYRLEVKPTVMTVAYKAYGNEEAADGKYWLGKLRLENDGEAPLDDLEVSYRIPGHIDNWTTPESSEQLLPGQTAGLAIYPKLPRTVTNIRTRTPATLEVKLTWQQDGEEQEQIERRDFEFRGVTEIEYTSLPTDEILGWYDQFDNAELTAAFVTHEDEVVRQYLGKISETQGGLPIVKDEKELAKVMKSMYDFMTQTGMTYAGNTGVPEKLGDAQSTVQSVRLPRDVIYQNSGLCIELAMLWAALGKGAGADAYLILVPGHCYPMLKAEDGTMIAIESTGIGGSNLGGVASFEQAVKSGMDQFRKLLNGELPGIIVSVGDEQADGIRPPEFDRADLAGLSEMLAKRVQNRQIQPTPGPNPNPNPNPQPGGSFASVNVAGVQVPYPANYQQNPMIVAQVQPMLPSYVFTAADASGMRAVDAYDFGRSSSQQAIGQLTGFASQMGAQMNIGQGQQQSFRGQAATFHPLQFFANGMQIQGGIFFVQSQNGGLVGVAVTSPDGSWQQVATQIAAGQ